MLLWLLEFSTFWNFQTLSKQVERSEFTSFPNFEEFSKFSISFPNTFGSAGTSKLQTFQSLKAYLRIRRIFHLLGNCDSSKFDSLATLRTSRFRNSSSFARNSPPRDFRILELFPSFVIFARRRLRGAAIRLASRNGRELTASNFRNADYPIQEAGKTHGRNAIAANRSVAAAVG